MYKKYDEKNKKWTEVDESTLSEGRKDTIRKRTESFIRLCRFNKSNPKKMAGVLATINKMYFILNCPLEIDTEAKCNGLIKNVVPFSYEWKDSYIEDIIECRKIYFKTYAKKY